MLSQNQIRVHNVYDSSNKIKSLKDDSMLNQLNNNDCSLYIPQRNIYLRGEYSITNTVNTMLRNCIVKGIDLTTSKTCRCINTLTYQNRVIGSFAEDRVDGIGLLDSMDTAQRQRVCSCEQR